MVWLDDTTGSYEVYYKKSTDGGIIWSTSKRITGTVGSSSSLAMGVDPSGNVHVVRDDNTPGNYEIHYISGK